MAKKILIVDDEPLNIKMASFMISKTEYESISATSGQECLELLSHESVDLILLDLLMPAMSGIETLRQIKEQDNLRDIPVLIFSGTYDMEDVEKAKELGAAGFVKKPISPQELMPKIKDLIG